MICMQDKEDLLKVIISGISFHFEKALVSISSYREEIGIVIRILREGGQELGDSHEEIRNNFSNLQGMLQDHVEALNNLENIFKTWPTFTPPITGTTILKS